MMSNAATGTILSNEIDSPEAAAVALRKPGLPTYMATNILEKLMTAQDALTARRFAVRRNIVRRDGRR